TKNRTRQFLKVDERGEVVPRTCGLWYTLRNLLFPPTQYQLKTLMATLHKKFSEVSREGLTETEENQVTEVMEYLNKRIGKSLEKFFNPEGIQEFEVDTFHEKTRLYREIGQLKKEMSNTVLMRLEQGPTFGKLEELEKNELLLLRNVLKKC